MVIWPPELWAGADCGAADGEAPLAGEAAGGDAGTEDGAPAAADVERDAAWVGLVSPLAVGEV